MSEELLIWNCFRKDCIKYVDYYNEGYVSITTLSNLIQENINILTNSVSKCTQIEAVYIMRSFPDFIDENFEPFFGEITFGVFLGKVSLCLLKLLFRYFSTKIYVDDKILYILKATLRYMSLSEIVEEYCFISFFRIIEHGNKLLEYITTNADQTIKLFSVVLFSASDGCISSYIKTVLNSVYENKIRFHKLVNKDHILYIRSLIKIMNKMKWSALQNFFYDNEYKLLIDFVFLIQSLFRHVSKTLERPHHSDYLCTLLMYTSEFFKNVIYCTSYEIPKRLNVILADTYLEATECLQKIDSSWINSDYMLYVYGFNENEYQSLSAWLNEIKYSLKDGIYHMLQYYEFYLLISNDRYISIFHSLEHK